jgi:hypothetical protein
MMKHNDKMVDTDAWYLAMRQQAAEAEARSRRRAKDNDQQGRKRWISALKYAGYTFVLVAFVAVTIGLVAIVLGVR